jgi:hypothetical protein
VFGNKCLDVPEGRFVDGTKLQIWTCSTNNANQKWGYTVRLVFARLVLISVVDVFLKILNT